MNSLATSEICPRTRQVFTAAWSAELGVALAAAAPQDGYPMSLVGADCEAVIAAVNQGIDAYLEACFVPDRGDQFGYTLSRRGSGGVPGARLECHLSPESLVTLVRRLLQADDPTAESLAAGICQTLGLELV
jgi:hypothetical protein